LGKENKPNKNQEMVFVWFIFFSQQAQIRENK
jgi:hypothetical protein